MKLRIWYPNEKKFYYSTPETIEFILGKDAFCEPYTIQVCIGKLKGKDLYEGDIIEKTGTFGIVTYDKKLYYYYLAVGKNGETCIYGNNSKCIGNIFENPDLAKKIKREII